MLLSFQIKTLIVNKYTSKKPVLCKNLSIIFLHIVLSHQLCHAQQTEQPLYNSEIQKTDNQIQKTDNLDEQVVNNQEDFDDNTVDNDTVYDPLRPYNEVVFNANMAIDTYATRPMTQTYTNVTPKLLRKGITNFFNNVKEPWSSFNLLLQGRPVDSMTLLTRFSVNTITTLGLGDPAASILNLNRTQEDFGQTLAVWGVPDGAYFVMPVYGPMTVRDAVARVLDVQMNPVTLIDNTAIQLLIYGLENIDKRAYYIQFEGVFESSYEVVREAELQNRKFVIHDGKKDTPTDDDFDEGFGD